MRVPCFIESICPVDNTRVLFLVRRQDLSRAMTYRGVDNWEPGPNLIMVIPLVSISISVRTRAWGLRSTRVTL